MIFKREDLSLGTFGIKSTEKSVAGFCQVIYVAGTQTVSPFCQLGPYDGCKSRGSLRSAHMLTALKSFMDSILVVNF